MLPVSMPPADQSHVLLLEFHCQQRAKKESAWAGHVGSAV